MRKRFDGDEIENNSMTKTEKEEDDLNELIDFSVML